MAELLCVNPVEMEMEMENLNLQNDVQLKSQQHSQHCWNLVALKMSALFGSILTFVKQFFSDMNVRKKQMNIQMTP